MNLRGGNPPPLLVATVAAVHNLTQLGAQEAVRPGGICQQR
jgi:hypothetical protein